MVLEASHLFSMSSTSQLSYLKTNDEKSYFLQTFRTVGLTSLWSVGSRKNEKSPFKCTCTDLVRYLSYIYLWRRPKTLQLCNKGSFMTASGSDLT
jgi:hypothetical protein